MLARGNRMPRTIDAEFRSGWALRASSDNAFVVKGEVLAGLGHP
jgi:hypothetical protein